MVLSCGDAAGWAPRAAEAGDEVVAVAGVPGRAEVDPVLDRATRLVVAGSDAALAAAPVTVRATYTTPVQHHSPMEPHATIACWEGEHVVVHESSQGVAGARDTIAALFGLGEDDVEVASPHVGGGFGVKGSLHAGTVLTVLGTACTLAMWPVL